MTLRQVAESDVKPFLKRFDELDSDGSGRLDQVLHLLHLSCLLYVLYDYGWDGDACMGWIRCMPGMSGNVSQPS